MPPPNQLIKKTLIQLSASVFFVFYVSIMSDLLLFSFSRIFHPQKYDYFKIDVSAKIYLLLIQNSSIFRH